MAIVLRYDEDGMFGSKGPDGYDVEACYENFEAQLLRAVNYQYPELDVTVEYSPNQDQYDSPEDEKFRPWIDDIVGKVFSSFYWVVEKE